MKKQLIIAALLSTAYFGSTLSMNSDSEEQLDTLVSKHLPELKQKDDKSKSEKMNNFAMPIKQTDETIDQSSNMAPLVTLLQFKQQWLNNLSNNLGKYSKELRGELEFLIKAEYKSLFRHLNYLLGHNNGFVDKYCAKE